MSGEKPLWQRHNPGVMPALEEPSKLDKEARAGWDALPPEAQNKILKAALAARAVGRGQLREQWLEIGEGLVAVRDEALHLAHTQNIQHPIYRRYFRLLLQRVPDLAALREQNTTACTHAVWMFEHWPLLESLLATEALGRADTNVRLNNPTAIWRRFHFEAEGKAKPQGAEKAPSPLARKDARIAELETELEQARRDLHVLKRGSDSVSEGRDWTWSDDPATVAEVWMRLYPSAALKIASKVLELNKPTAPRKVRRGVSK